jgi:hypothetical protein
VGLVGEAMRLLEKETTHCMGLLCTYELFFGKEIQVQTPI